MSHLLIYGNAFAQIIRNGRGEVLGLYPLMPDKIRVDRDEQNRLIYKYSRYDEANPNLKEQGEIILPAEQVLHIPGLGFDGLVGYSPIAMAKNAIGLAVACDEYGASFFANGASPSGVLEHPGIIKDPERVRNAWHRAYGSGNAHKIAVALILKALYSMFQASEKNIFSYVVMAVSLILTAFLKIDAVCAIIGCAVFGLLRSWIYRKEQNYDSD